MGAKKLAADSRSATANKRAGVGFWVSVVALATAHVGLTQYFVPLREVLSGRPLQGIDFDLHIGQIYRVVDALDRWGHSWLYDVHLLAGQPEGTITDSGSKGWELWTYALHGLGLSKALAFNAFVLAVMWACPLLIFAGARNFSLSRAASLLAAAMASALWFFDSHIHWIWFVGMVSWAGASCLSVLTLGLFYRMVEQRRLRLAPLCALSLGVGLLIHPYTFFVLALPMAALYLRARAQLGWSGLLSVASIALFALALNAYWLHNALVHWHYILNSAFYAQASPEHVICDLLDVLCNGADTGAIGTRTAFRFLFLGFALVALYRWHKQGDRRALPLGLGIAALYVCAYLGGFLPGMQQTQPYRQITPASLLTTVPAAAFVEAQWRQRRSIRMPTELRLLLAVACFALVKLLTTSQVMYYFPKLMPTPKDHPDGLPSPLSGYGFRWVPGDVANFNYAVPHDPATFETGGAAIVNWLKTHVPGGDRVLIEGSLLGERVAWSTDLEVLGGFFERNVEHVDANYFRKYQHYVAPPAELDRYLHTFAVQWVVSSRPDFERVPGVLRVIATIAGHRIYKTVAPVDRVLQGGGQVRASENRIELRGTTPNEPVVLAYHWHEALRCKPECRVERAASDLDRVGFIRIPAPHPANMLVWNSYELR